MPEDQVKIKKESSSSAGLTCCSDDNYYPYGTSLSIDDDLIEKLNISSLARGDVVEVRGYAFVDSKYSSEDEDGKSTSMRLQMTSISLERENDDRAVQLYGDQS